MVPAEAWLVHNICVQARRSTLINPPGGGESTASSLAQISLKGTGGSPKFLFTKDLFVSSYATSQYLKGDLQVKAEKGNCNQDSTN